MNYANKDTTDYLVGFRNAQKVIEVCKRSLITRGVQENGMNIIFPFHNTEFDYLREGENKEAEKAGEETLFAILYIEN